VKNGLSHRNFLMEIASYGYLAIAIGPLQATPARGQQGPAPAAKGDAKQAAPTGPATKSSELLDAINWAMSQNGQKGSMYQGKLDPSKIAVMGMSCGGIQARRWRRIHASNWPGSGMAAFSICLWPPGLKRWRTCTKTNWRKLHSPIFYVNGGKTEIAYENGLDDYNRIT
jgi:hypothetical protein